MDKADRIQKINEAISTIQKNEELMEFWKTAGRYLLGLGKGIIKTGLYAGAAELAGTLLGSKSKPGAGTGRAQGSQVSSATEEGTAKHKLIAVKERS